MAVANTEQGVLAAQIGWRTAELNFKRLIVSGTDDDAVPDDDQPDRPADAGVCRAWTFRPAVTRALAERTDIVASRRNLDVSRLNLEVTKGQLKPHPQLQRRLSARAARAAPSA